MRASGKMVKLVVKAVFGMLMETHMKVCGFKIKQMDTASIYMQMEQNMLVFGKTMFNMDAAQKHGLMDQLLKVTMLMGKSTDKALTNGQMAPRLLEVGQTIK